MAFKVFNRSYAFSICKEHSATSISAVYCIDIKGYQWLSMTLKYALRCILLDEVRKIGVHRLTRTSINRNWVNMKSRIPSNSDVQTYWLRSREFEFSRQCLKKVISIFFFQLVRSFWVSFNWYLVLIAVDHYQFSVMMFNSDFEWFIIIGKCLPYEQRQNFRGYVCRTIVIQGVFGSYKWFEGAFKKCFVHFYVICLKFSWSSSIVWHLLTAWSW